MDLFQIDRYDCDAAKKAADSEEQLLIRLHNRIQERKQKLLCWSSEKSPVQVGKFPPNAGSAHAVQKKKKRKEENSIAEMVSAMPANTSSDPLEFGGGCLVQSNAKRKKVVANASTGVSPVEKSTILDEADCCDVSSRLAENAKSEFARRKMSKTKAAVKEVQADDTTIGEADLPVPIHFNRATAGDVCFAKIDCSDVASSSSGVPENEHPTPIPESFSVLESIVNSRQVDQSALDDTGSRDTLVPVTNSKTKRKNKVLSKDKQIEDSSHVDLHTNVCPNVDFDGENSLGTSMLPDGKVVEVTELHGSADNEVVKLTELRGSGADSDKPFLILGRHKRPKKGPVKNPLPRWLSEPIAVSASLVFGKVPLEEIGFLQPNSISNLRKAGISHLFPIQSSVIPFLLAQTSNSSIYGKAGLLPKDVCVQAPTGSGKTISYVIPMVEILGRAAIRQLYAVVVLPSKDLAIQVKKVFDLFTQGTRIKVALVSGVNSFAKEQEKLVAKCLDRYLSKVDIIVCTPGRLVDHMKQTQGFSLSHLRFLVLDEADRLLGEAYNNWLDEILRRAYARQYSSLLARIPRPACTAGSMMVSYSPLQKLLFSATLTKSPEKLASLCLHQPVLFACHASFASGEERQEAVVNDGSRRSSVFGCRENKALDSGDKQTVENVSRPEGEESLQYILPAGLKQQMVIVEAGEKPMVVLHLLTTLKYTGVLCFTKSIEATHRLYLLLSEFKSIRLAEFSSSLTEVQRKGIIRDFRAGLIDVVVSSDAMARGMDLSNVSVVLNYDTPTNAKTYVHRVGRTARAGAEGLALTILTFKEVYHFKQMCSKLSSADRPTKFKLAAKDLSVFVVEYEQALEKLKSSVLEEKKKEKSCARSSRTGSSIKRTRV